MAVSLKAWLWPWNTGLSPSLREEDSSLRSESKRLQQWLHGMGSISHRFTMPTDPWRTDPWRTDLMREERIERMSPWARVQVKRSKRLFEIQRKTECHRSALFSREVKSCYE